MDAVSYSHSAKQAQRIKKFIANPDSASGIVTVPKKIEAGETVTVPAGRVAVLPNVQVDGTLNVEGDGEVFIPAGTTLSKVVELEGDQTIAGVKTFSSSPIVPTPTTNTQAVNKNYVVSLVGQPSITGSITLNGTTNNTVVLTSIVTELSLEVGDVVRIDTGAYNKLHTVESITDNDSIIVNYEHAGNRGNGSLKLPDFTGQATVTRIAKWFNAPIGLGQAWVDLTRQTSVNITNSTNRNVLVWVRGLNSDVASITINGLTFSNAYSASTALSGINYMVSVPAGGVYLLSSMGNTQNNKYRELR